ncbi:MAG: glycosyltransferase, partial [Micromonosporaceae bacterium]
AAGSSAAGSGAVTGRDLPLPAGVRGDLAAPAPAPVPGISVVIPAHNEAAVLGRCLDTLLADARPGEIDVVVVANGCTDETLAVARDRGVRAVAIAKACKQAALNGGDAIARGFPRIYLDADVFLPTAGIRALADAVRVPGRLAATPARHLDLHRRPVLVRGYYAVNARLPAYRTGLFGRGAVALSAAGRARFDRFPDGLTADDLFLDALFSDAEKIQAPAARVTIATPRRTRDLVRRLAAIRAGTAALRADRPGARPAKPWSWLKDVVVASPRLAPAAVCYVGIVLAAELRRRVDRLRGRTDWGRDESSRELPAAEGVPA